MRHQRKGHRLARPSSHRKATLAALGNALIKHKRITTTEPKAKALRVFIEPLLTRAKEDTSHNRRQVFRRLQDKETVTTLFSDVAEHLGDRNGGYTRIVKLGQRAGDGAPMAVIELVDYNDVRPEETGAGRKRTRRGASRRGRGKAAGEEKAAPKAATAKRTEEAREEAEETTGIGAQAGTAEVVAETAEAEETVVAETAEAEEPAVAETAEAEETAVAEETAKAEETAAAEEAPAAEETPAEEATAADQGEAPGDEAVPGDEEEPKA